MTLVPYLKFDGKAEEAMNFYKDALKGELEIQKIGESPMAEGMPKETFNNVLHASLTKDGVIILFGSDMVDMVNPNGANIIPGNTVYICLSCNVDEIHGLFDKISVGGKITDPLQEQFFGFFGTIEDKYGHHWMFEAAKSIK